MKSAADLIEDALRRTGVMALNPNRRRQAAERLHANGFKSGHVVMVWHEAQRGTGDAHQARGLLATVIEDIPRFKEVVQDQEETERRRREPQESGLHFVSEENPYGWSQPERMRWFDHSRPGEWNGYRRSQNLTTAEARELGVTDVRRHGCSRPEVLGDADFEKVRRIRAGKGNPGEVIKDATSYWDPLPVECARGLALPPSPEVPDRPIYGEAQP